MTHGDRMINFTRIIIYLVLYAVNAMLYVFLHSHFYFTLLILMTAAPFISIIAALLLKRGIRISADTGLMDTKGDLSVSRGAYSVRQREEAFFSIAIKNPTAFVCLDADVELELTNDFFKTKGTKKLTVPLRSFEGFRSELPVIAEYPGIIGIRILSVTIRDMMGFIRLMKRSDAHAEVVVLPAYSGALSVDGVNLQQGVLESEESTKRGNDFSDVQEIREYIPGDKLMSIHWKLSAKRDILMVKDRVSMSDKQMVILPELCGRDRMELEAILSTTYTMIRNLVSEKTTVRLMYWSAACYEYQDVRIDYTEELDTAFEKLFYEQTYENMDEGASHMPDVHPEMKAFVHIKAEAGRAMVGVRENG